MARWVVGDLHGCFDSFLTWLEQSPYDECSDELWFVGDLVNRGPKSLECLRWVYEHRSKCRVVLGNHDVHLIACYLGAAGPKRRDTLQDVLTAPDSAILLEWLRRQPLALSDGDVLMVHAGVLPNWSLSDVLGRAQEVQGLLASEQAADFLRASLQRGPKGAYPRELEALEALTRMRTIVRSSCGLDAEYKGTLDEMPTALAPWFRVPRSIDGSVRIVFGHWAALGLYEGSSVVAVDSGCVWGKRLSGYDLDDAVFFSVDAVERPDA